MRPKGNSGLCAPPHPQASRDSLSYFLKLWDEPTSLSFLLRLCRGTLQKEGPSALCM